MKRKKIILAKINLLLLTLLISCTSIQITEADNTGKILTKKTYSSYSLRKSRSKQIHLIKKKKYFKALFHCRASFKIHSDKIDSNLVYRTLMTSILRYEKNDSKDLDEIYNNNQFILETLEILSLYKAYVDIDIYHLFKQILEEGSQDQSPFLLFIISLDRKLQTEINNTHTKTKTTFFEKLKSDYPRWFSNYNIQKVDQWNLKDLLI